MFGDDIYDKDDVKRVTRHKYSILTSKVKNPELFGVIVQNNNIVANIIEKPKLFVSDIISCGLFSLDKKIFSMLKKIKKSKRGEYEMTDAVRQLAAEESIYCVKAKRWLPIGYPWDLLKADDILRNKKNLIGKNTKIEGKVENSSVGDNCIIKGKVKNSMIMDNTTIEKDSVVEDSIIGENVYFKGAAKSGRNINSMVKEKPVLAERLGAIIADKVAAEDVFIKPGCKIWPNKKISGEINNDVE